MRQGMNVKGGARLVLCGLLLAGLGLSASGAAQTAAGTRAHDARTFKPVVPEVKDLPGAKLYKGVYEGERGPASYLIEVPEKWNGTLVMYTHGYRGTGENLTVDPPPIREYLLSQGYGWAASSYSANYYDVRAGVEDTNKLALEFGKLTQGAHGSPKKYYIMGFSMGGHVAGAAVEAETLATANNKVRYAASLPLCGVMAPEELFHYLNDYTLAAQHLAGLGPTQFPVQGYQKILPGILSKNFQKFSTNPAELPLWTTTPLGEQLRDVARYLSGGARPVFNQGFNTARWQLAVFSAGGSDGTINGILNRRLVDNTNTVYQLDDDPALSAVEQLFNMTILRVKAEENANPMRSDGLRWLPAINAEFGVPVLTLHTLGDLYVPFGLQQTYLLKAQAKGSADRLVQRAIRAAGHCEFAPAELVQAFNDLAVWEQTGQKPAGDDILTKDVVADPNYGCRFTRATRPGVEACPGT